MLHVTFALCTIRNTPETSSVGPLITSTHQVNASKLHNFNYEFFHLLTSSKETPHIPVRIRKRSDLSIDRCEKNEDFKGEVIQMSGVFCERICLGGKLNLLIPDLHGLLNLFVAFCHVYLDLVWVEKKDVYA